MNVVPGRVSVIIVNYNAVSYAQACLRAVLANEYRDYEIIVIDNGSKDGSVEALTSEFGNAGVRVIALGENLGPSAARNLAAREATGEYFAFLDNDTEPKPDWITRAVERFQSEPDVAAIQCKLLLLRQPDCFDYVGDYLGSFGFLIQPVHGGDKDVGQAESSYEILSAKSAGMFVRSDAFRHVDGFDDDYFIYVEETDLGLKLWLAGYRSVYEPRSVVLHAFGTSAISSPDQHHYRARFHGTKNYVLTLVKNLETSTLVRILPMHVALWLGFAGLNMAKGRVRSGFWILSGLWWNVVNLPRTLAKRRAVQAKRKWSDSVILARVGRRDSLRSLYAKATGVRAIGNYRPGNLGVSAGQNKP
ncbi:MAG: glycosyltransferase family 2 protein [Vulcanimicrobiaceae bacterium]|jgi:GT2 family glycosyltransferase